MESISEHTTDLYAVSVLVVELCPKCFSTCFHNLIIIEELVDIAVNLYTVMFPYGFQNLSDRVFMVKFSFQRPEEDKGCETSSKMCPDMFICSDKNRTGLKFCL